MLREGLVLAGTCAHKNGFTKPEGLEYATFFNIIAISHFNIIAISHFNYIEVKVYRAEWSGDGPTAVFTLGRVMWKAKYLPFARKFVGENCLHRDITIMEIRAAKAHARQHPLSRMIKAEIHWYGRDRHVR